MAFLVPALQVYITEGTGLVESVHGNKTSCVRLAFCTQRAGMNKNQIPCLPHLNKQKNWKWRQKSTATKVSNFLPENRRTSDSTATPSPRMNLQPRWFGVSSKPCTGSAHSGTYVWASGRAHLDDCSSHFTELSLWPMSILLLPMVAGLLPLILTEWQQGWTAVTMLSLGHLERNLGNTVVAKLLASTHLTLDSPFFFEQSLDSPFSRTQKSCFSVTRFYSDMASSSSSSDGLFRFAVCLRWSILVITHRGHALPTKFEMNWRSSTLIKAASSPSEAETSCRGSC
jgi:hypothetical protein